MMMAAGASYAQGQSDRLGPRDSSTQSQMSGSKDKQYVQKMLMANMAEIQLGQMAADRASSSEVKSFGQMMVTDHTKANEELKPIAQQLGVQPPTELDSKHRALADKLSKLQGAEFDRQFMAAMVDGHKEVVKETQSIAGGKSSTAASSSTGTGTATASGSGATGSGTTASGSGTTGSGTTGSSAGGSAVGTSGSGSSSGAQQSVMQYASKTLPIVQHHLQQAQTVRQTTTKSGK